LKYAQRRGRSPSVIVALTFRLNLLDRDNYGIIELAEVPMPMDEKLLLRRLARLFNVQTSHYDGFGRLVKPPPEAILRVLRMLGAAVENPSDLPSAFRDRRQALWRMAIDPVIVTWASASPQVKLRLPGALAERPVNYDLSLEDGAALRGRCLDAAKVGGPALKPLLRSIEGTDYVVRRLTVPETPPAGYHRLRLTIGDLVLESFVFVAPLRAFNRGDAAVKAWGIFCPVYALHSERSWGIGDFTDLESCLSIAEDAGARVAGTLPLLSAFLDEPFNPSPYAPVSRIFWNELFLDLTRIPELQNCPPARALLESSTFQEELYRLRESRYIDYRRAMALKRTVLKELVRRLLKSRSERRASFDSFVATHPLAQDYAAFCAKTERERVPWERWSQISRDGKLKRGDYDENVRKYHLYVQWQAHEQIGSLAAKTKGGGSGLYLDFPLGVNRDGYDVWRDRDAFALAASGGAPPDAFFTKGQDWGFPPFHPEGLRRQGYRYYIHCMRHHLQYAEMLRIDHVMGLHRSYWVPAGFGPSEGVYVRYPAEEFYAVLNLESHRHKAEIIGENLGTVPPYVNSALVRHGIRGMHVGQFGVRTDPGAALDRPGSRTVASLNTHDTPTFASFWSGADIDDRVALGLLSEADSVAEHAHRRAQRDALVSYLIAGHRFDGADTSPEAVLRAWLSALAASEADFILVNLEDLWLEPSPQNVPGTWEERPNWRRKARFSLEEISHMPGLLDTLRMIDEIRKNER
jgi:4-alpha-glucanotransferase